MGVLSPKQFLINRDHADRTQMGSMLVCPVTPPHKEIHRFLCKHRFVVVKLLSPVQLFCNSVDCSPQAPLFLEFPRQECWSREPFPSPGDLPDQGIELESPALRVDSLSLSL